VRPGAVVERPAPVEPAGLVGDDREFRVDHCPHL
jgi:hypothetical protein